MKQYVLKMKGDDKLLTVKAVNELDAIDRLGKKYADVEIVVTEQEMKNYGYTTKKESDD